MTLFDLMYVNFFIDDLKILNDFQPFFAYYSGNHGYDLKVHAILSHITDKYIGIQILASLRPDSVQVAGSHASQGWKFEGLQRVLGAEPSPGQQLQSKSIIWPTDDYQIRLAE